MNWLACIQHGGTKVALRPATRAVRLIGNRFSRTATGCLTRALASMTLRAAEPQSTLHANPFGVVSVTAKFPPPPLPEASDPGMSVWRSGVDRLRVRLQPHCHNCVS